MSALREAALKYARAGWHVFPLVDKRPITDHGHLDATTDPEQIKGWWAAHPDASIGVHCRASGFLAVDVDPRNGGDQTWERLEEDYGDLEPTCRQRTPGGGFHLLFADPSPGPDGWTRRHEDGGDVRGKLGAGVDLKCNGYVVVDPSPGYVWEALDVRDGRIVVPALINWPEDLLRKSGDQGEGPGVDAWRDSVGGQLTNEQAAELRRALAELGPRGAGNATTFKAVATIFHGFGLSVDEGWPYLLEWNAGSGDPHPVHELRRQVERVADRSLDRERGWLRATVDLLAAGLDTPTDVELAPRADEVARRPRRPKRCYPTFCPELDDALGGGLWTRRVTTVCAPPGSGKTAWATTVALHVEAESRLPVLHVSTELDLDEMLARYDGCATGRVWRDIDRGDVPVSDALNGRMIHLVGCDELPATADEVLAMIDRQVALLTERYGVQPLAVVDYLQDVARGTDEGQRRGAIGAVVKGLRSMSVRRDCAAIAVSSVSRAYYSGPRVEQLRQADDARVYLAAAKESGDVDFDSGAVLFLDVDEVTPEISLARVAVAKSRSGHPGRFCGAQFHGASGRWESDPGALLALAPEGRKARQAGEDEAACLEYLQTASGADAVATRAAQNVPGVSRNRAREAIKRLRQSDRVHSVEETYLDSSGKPQKRDVIVVGPRPTEAVLRSGRAVTQ